MVSPALARALEMSNSMLRLASDNGGLAVGSEAISD
jgi:hypothetical protein